MLIRQHRPDLAVLDAKMPNLTGLDVTRALAADPATAAIPVIIASARGQASDIEAGLTAGARSYLVKPFSPPELANRVAAILAT